MSTLRVQLDETSDLLGSFPIFAASPQLPFLWINAEPIERVSQIQTLHAMLLLSPLFGNFT